MTAFVLTPPSTVGEALRLGAAHLRDVGIGAGNVEAALLLSLVMRLDRLKLITHLSRELSAEEERTFSQLVTRRAHREPLQYITGSVEFMGLEFEVSPAVLIPRPDTEILVEAVLDAEEVAGAREGVILADVGAGSGAIAVSLASYLRYATVVAVELSPLAANVARANIARHGVEDRVELLVGDGLAPLAPYAGKLTYLVSNPPYIADDDLEGLDPEVRDHEPRMALTPGSDPLHWYRLFADKAPDYLLPRGTLAVEVGIDQAQDVKDLLETTGRWEDITVCTDLAGIERIVCARRSP